MNLKELTWPVRVYWDLTEETAGGPETAVRIAEELIAIKVLYLSMRDLSSPLSPASRAVLDRLGGGPLAVSLTLASAALRAGLPAGPKASPVRSLFAECVSLAQVRELCAAGMPHGGTIAAGICFPVGPENYREVPDVAGFCRKQGIRDLLFPIQRLIGTGEPFCITSSMLAEIATAVQAQDLSALRITIHDPFLWPVFFPGKDYHEGGCQAANSMLYISPEAKVYPCPAMPLLLGDLRTTSLRDIVLSEAKKDLRRTLLRPAESCSTCEQATVCLGGCRGRALAVAGSLDRRDPACA
jgi:GeoRSP system SPASM domain protein